MIRDFIILIIIILLIEVIHYYNFKTFHNIYLNKILEIILLHLERIQTYFIILLVNILKYLYKKLLYYIIITLPSFEREGREIVSLMITYVQ